MYPIHLLIQSLFLKGLKSLNTCTMATHFACSLTCKQQIEIRRSGASLDRYSMAIRKDSEMMFKLNNDMEVAKTQVETFYTANDAPHSRSVENVRENRKLGGLLGERRKSC